MKEQFEKHNTEVTFIRNNKHIKGGIYGCFESHIICIKDAIENDLEYCLIFEDDNIIIDTYKESISIAKDFFSKNIEAEILYFQNRGLLCAYEKVDEYIYKCVSYGTSCYILNRKGMDKIIKHYVNYLEYKIHYDQFLMKITQNNAYHCIKYITTSYLSSSDNDYNSLKQMIIPYIGLIEPYINTFVFGITVPLMKINILKRFYLNYILYNMYLK